MAAPKLNEGELKAPNTKVIGVALVAAPWTPLESFVERAVVTLVSPNENIVRFVPDAGVDGANTNTGGETAFAGWSS